MIKFDEYTKVFAIQTAHSDYQMQIGEYGILFHLYYGKPVGDTQITYRIGRKDVGFSGNPPEAEDDRTFSLDTLPQEYSGFGNGDYRAASAEIVHADGSNVVDFRYKSHRIVNGKYDLPGLPAVFSDEEEAQTLVITLEDYISKIEVDLYYGVIAPKDIITRAVVLRNMGEKSVTIKRAMSMSIDFPEADWDWVHFYGRHCMERNTERQQLRHGIQSVGSTRGMSSHHHNPFFILCDRSASEEHGSCYGMTFIYSGSFLGELEVDQMDQTRITMGISPTGFAWNLEPGKVFTTPEVMLIYSEEGFSTLSRRQHNAFREHIIRSPYVKKRRPILVNSWEAAYFDFDNQKLYEIAKEAKEIGIEMLVMDDGWFGARDHDKCALGDWYVNEEKLKGGLPALVEKVNELGLQFGIWVEPEMISKDSDLYRAHPEWCMEIPKRPGNKSRDQMNLDIARADVRDAVMEQIFAVLDSCPIAYVKWDMNRSVANVYSNALPAKQQGEVMHRYILGLYDMLDRLTKRYPKLLLETCSGGGGRFDAGMLYYSPQIWCSDNTDAIERLKIQYGTSFAYPISTMGSHVSACPNHQTGRTVPFETRGVVAKAGTFGYELDFGKMSAEEKAQAKKQIEAYMEIAPLVLNGNYSRLSDPFATESYVAWQFTDKEQEKAVVSGVLVRAEANERTKLIHFKDLCESKRYCIDGQDQEYTGAALMYGGLMLPKCEGDFQSFEFKIEAV